MGGLDGGFGYPSCGLGCGGPEVARQVSRWDEVVAMEPHEQCFAADLRKCEVVLFAGLVEQVELIGRDSTREDFLPCASPPIHMIEVAFAYRHLGWSPCWVA